MARSLRQTHPAKIWKGRKRRNRVTRGQEAYRWSDRERDPDMMFLVDRMHEDNRSIAELADRSFCSATTLYNWDDGKVANPRSINLSMLGRTLGLTRAWVDEAGHVHVAQGWDERIKILEKAERKKQRLAKKNGHSA